MISPPRGVWATSGWNWTPNNGFSRCSKAAIGELSLDAVTVITGRGHIDVISVAHPDRGFLACSEPWKSLPPFTVTFARPYSRRMRRSTRPPESCASTCMP